MLKRLLRRILRSAFAAEFAELDARYGRELGIQRRKYDRLKEFYNDLSDSYDRLLTYTTNKARDGT